VHALSKQLPIFGGSKQNIEWQKGPFHSWSTNEQEKSGVNAFYGHGRALF
jgi:hypothetical protein